LKEVGKKPKRPPIGKNKDGSMPALEGMDETRRVWRTQTARDGLTGGQETQKTNFLKGGGKRAFSRFPKRKKKGVTAMSGSRKTNNREHRGLIIQGRRKRGSHLVSKREGGKTNPKQKPKPIHLRNIEKDRQHKNQVTHAKRVYAGGLFLKSRQGKRETSPD